MWWDLDKNISIFGGTQQGKSVLANEIYTKSNRIGIFWNPDGESFVKGWKVKSKQDIVKGMNKGYKKFSFEMPWYSLDDTGKYEKLVYFLLHLGEQRNASFILVNDEAHEIAPQGARKTPLHLANKRGLKRGLKNLNLTQDPAVLSSSVTKQSDRMVWVGPMSSQDKSYVKERLKVEPSELPNVGQYEYIVLNRQGDVIATGETSTKYA